MRIGFRRFSSCLTFFLRKVGGNAVFSYQAFIVADLLAAVSIGGARVDLSRRWRSLRRPLNIKTRHDEIMAFYKLGYLPYRTDQWPTHVLEGARKLLENGCSKEEMAKFLKETLW